ncbi:MAG: flavodoxin-dependent (E)-4-hydroxy-3-methylbut-2-enyl-diphosphate synthase [Tissierellia bacterium]|nr:flavodoxin-dependent (E)-4-hydroxy-3-methylbut-2-enyl-diphosphate synthase [Tissierellia bacterium]
MKRKNTKQIFVGSVPIGGQAPISVQSMTNTNTKNVQDTVKQIKGLEKAGCDLIRFAVNDLDDAKAIPKIKEQISIPTIADIQFDYRLAIASAKSGIDGLRINPGNIGAKWKVQEVVSACQEFGISIRVGVNSGSLEQKYIDKYKGVTPEAICYSALGEIELLEAMGFTNIKVSLKSSNVNQSIEAYRLFSSLSNYPLHLGITESGRGMQGIVKSSVGLGTLLSEGIGDTLRVSLTDDPIEEIKVGRQILKSLDLLKEGVEIISCPTCARTKIELIPLVEKVEKLLEDKKTPLKVAIMGCVVNGPGEAKEADLGITGGNGTGLIFRKGEIIRRVPEDDLLEALLEEINHYELGE